VLRKLVNWQYFKLILLNYIVPYKEVLSLNILGFLVVLRVV
jgi:hypothetical protein